MKNDGASVLQDHRIVSHDEWLTARQALLAKEKELTRLRDELSAARRALPWEPVTKPYLFDGPDGREDLGRLFGGRSQLVVYHAMFNPKTAAERTPWTRDAACKTCTFWIDNFHAIVPHLEHRDVTLIAASRAPVDKLLAYQKRMGWHFKWVSTAESDFNHDFNVAFTEREIAQQSGSYNYVQGKHPPLTELPGVSVFYRDPAGRIFHTYSTYSRGLDMLNVAYHYLDLVPKGRDEGAGNGLSWIQRRDEYDVAVVSADH